MYLFIALTLGMSLCIASGDHWHTKWRTPPPGKPLMAYDTAPLLMNAAYFALSAVTGLVTTGVAVHWGISVAAATNVQVALGARQGVKEAYQTMMRGATAVGLAAAGGAVTALFGIMVLFQVCMRNVKEVHTAVCGHHPLVFLKKKGFLGHTGSKIEFPPVSRVFARRVLSFSTIVPDHLT